MFLRVDSFMVLLQKPLPSHCTAGAPQVGVLGRSSLAQGSAVPGTAAPCSLAHEHRSGPGGDLTMPPALEQGALLLGASSAHINQALEPETGQRDMAHLCCSGAMETDPRLPNRP